MGDAELMMQSLEVLVSTWPTMIAGTALLMFGIWVGLGISKARSFIPVRWVSWWVSRVIIPLLYKRSWLVRTAAIFINNITILTLLVLIGAWSFAAIAGTALIGVSMGVALRVLFELPESFSIPQAEVDGSNRRRFRIGIMLNLIEPPAIIATLGLSLGRAVIPVTGNQTWVFFMGWIVPAMLIAAGGEALWIGVAVHSRRERSGEDHQSLNHDDVG